MTEEREAAALERKPRSAAEEAHALGKLELPSTESVRAEREAFSAMVDGSPRFLSVVKKLARNTFRPESAPPHGPRDGGGTLPPGHPSMEPVFSRKTGRLELPAADPASTKGAVAPADASERITPRERRVLLLGLALILFALIILAVGVALIVVALQQREQPAPLPAGEPAAPSVVAPTTTAAPSGVTTIESSAPATATTTDTAPAPTNTAGSTPTTTNTSAPIATATTAAPTTTAKPSTSGIYILENENR